MIRLLRISADPRRGDKTYPMGARRSRLILSSNHQFRLLQAMIQLSLGVYELGTLIIDFFDTGDALQPIPESGLDD